MAGTVFTELDDESVLGVSSVFLTRLIEMHEIGPPENRVVRNIAAFLLEIYFLITY